MTDIPNTARLNFTVNEKLGGLALATGPKYRKVSPDYIIRKGIGNSKWITGGREVINVKTVRQ